MQNLLFEGKSPIPVPIEDGEISLYPNWLDDTEAHALLPRLQKTLAWEQSSIRMQGREVRIPRLNAWYGDPGCEYQYSGYQLPLNDWTPELQRLRQKLEGDTGARFNSVLANWYRDGNDSVSWHSDDEPELGRNPVIASISLGATRRFSLKHRTLKQEPPVNLELVSGSLLLMAGCTQHNWKHSLPKTRKSTSARINLTFRHVLHKQERD